MSIEPDFEQPDALSDSLRARGATEKRETPRVPARVIEGETGSGTA